MGTGTAVAACPCGLKARYDACCGRYHAGPLQYLAPTAEALMRSRYSAYALELKPYLLETWHRETRPPGLSPEPDGVRWLGLEVRRHDQQDDRHATVEFVARSKLGGRAIRLHAVSRFVREGERWYYVDDEDGDAAA